MVTMFRSHLVNIGKKMDTIKIHYVDFWKKLDPENFFFTKMLKTKYNVVLDSENPDFVFCSNFGREYVKYDCIRILFLGEAKTPDFNVYDYAIGFDDITYSDRYLRYPLFLVDRVLIKKALNKHTFSDEYYLNKKKFCNQVVSNSSGDKIRDDFFDALSKYKQVDSGGRYRNNLPDGKPVASKEAFQKEYRFSLAFENCSYPGYVTEKIVDAFAADTIPIYWGDTDIANDFNPEAFIDCSKLSSLDEMVQAVKRVDENEELYLKMIKAPAVKGDSDKISNSEKYLEEFILSIVARGNNAYRRNSMSSDSAQNYENKFKQRVAIENGWLFIKAREIRNKIKNR